MEALEQVLKFVGAVVLAGGGVSLIAYQAFKHLAARWLDSKFDERLQALRHAHGKELEQLRFKIAALLDRTTKLHQKEFELLPEAWSKLNDAFWEVRAFVSPMQAYADIDRMTPPQQEEFIEGSRLTSCQKDELRKSDQKNLLFQKQIFWHRLHDVQGKTRDAYQHFMRNGIFLDKAIREKFSALHDLIWNALTEHQFNQEHELRPRDSEKCRELSSKGESMMKELEGIVHARLWPAESVPL